MSTLFTEQDSIDLAAEVEAQLRELRKKRKPQREFKDSFQHNDSPSDNDNKLIKQHQSIESLTQESSPSFLAKFGKAAKGDLCDETGLLHQQWQKWGDLNNKDALERLGGVLVAMGFTGGALRSLVVVVTVIVVHIRIKAFCEDYGQGAEK